MVKPFKIKIFADGADLDTMVRLARDPLISGFTTNPSLLRAAKVKSYADFAKEVVAAIPDLPVSFEVFSDDMNAMIEQATVISKWGRNVYVKIPVCNSKGVSTGRVIKTCVMAGIKVNVTAVFTMTQVRALSLLLESEVPSIVSIFAGRIADTGIDPMPTMAQAKRELHGTKAQLLWASPRELLNIFQAEAALCDIITLPLALLNKLPLLGKDLLLYSQQTSQEFYLDAQAMGGHIMRTLTVDEDEGGRLGVPHHSSGGVTA